MRVRKPSSLILRLCRKIHNQLGIDLDPETFERTYAGPNQKASGGFLWMMSTYEASGIRQDYGGYLPASELVKNKYVLTLENSGGIDGELNRV